MSQALAARAHLEAHGEPLPYTQTTPGAYDPNTGTYASGTTTSFTIQGAPVPFSLHQVDGTNVVAGDLQVVAAVQAFEAEGVEPQKGDTVTVAGSVYRVHDWEQHRVDAQTVAYTLHLRGVR